MVTTISTGWSSRAWKSTARCPSCRSCCSRPTTPSPIPSAAAAVNPHSTEARSTARSEEHTSELQSLMRISYAVFCLKKKLLLIFFFSFFLFFFFFLSFFYFFSLLSLLFFLFFSFLFFFFFL